MPAALRSTQPARSLAPPSPPCSPPPSPAPPPPPPPRPVAVRPAACFWRPASAPARSESLFEALSVSLLGCTGCYISLCSILYSSLFDGLYRTRTQTHDRRADACPQGHASLHLHPNLHLNLFLSGGRLQRCSTIACGRTRSGGRPLRRWTGGWGSWSPEKSCPRRWTGRGTGTGTGTAGRQGAGGSGSCGGCFRRRFWKCFGRGSGWA